MVSMTVRGSSPSALCVASGCTKQTYRVNARCIAVSRALSSRGTSRARSSMRRCASVCWLLRTGAPGRVPGRGWLRDAACANCALNESL